MKIVVKTLAETEALAQQLINEAQPDIYFLLKGEMGAGKTTFTKFLLKALGVEKVVSSPTFVLLNQYVVDGLVINHVDAYRLTKENDVDMFLEEFDAAFNIIEWYENLAINFEEVNYVKINFQQNLDGSRELIIEKKGE
jgi:tRNA threonylcarbamoyladenosine biosynthesis protein TsaE